MPVQDRDCEHVQWLNEIPLKHSRDWLLVSSDKLLCFGLTSCHLGVLARHVSR